MKTPEGENIPMRAYEIRLSGGEHYVTELPEGTELEYARLVGDGSHKCWRGSDVYLVHVRNGVIVTAVADQYGHTPGSSNGE